MQKRIGAHLLTYPSLISSVPKPIQYTPSFSLLLHLFLTIYINTSPSHFPITINKLLSELFLLHLLNCYLLVPFITFTLLCSSR
ncbi:unnamed protein product [Lactuca virosa]|uniref:Uncharacterized protein n=1 Tax=Lactuca virosa TaxID=75947 RepID=A0AAU9LV93_9ASTR|nr:unnamed protein product [Lactuca virosa]